VTRARAFALVASFLAAGTLATLASHAIAATDSGGYVGHGNVVLQTAIAGMEKLTVGGEIAFEQRGPLARVDVLSLGLPGTDPTLSALLGTQLFPPGGFTVVFDRTTSTYVVWSNTKHTYFTSVSSSQAAATPAPAASTPAKPTESSPFAFLKTVRDDTSFSVTLSLAGHGPINGHPATGIDYQLNRTTKAGDKSNLHGRIEFADDLDELPIELTASVNTRTIPQSSLRLDLTSIARETPNEADFAVPQGYARAGDLGSVLGKTLSL
jgi:hypothetical protein